MQMNSLQIHNQNKLIREYAGQQQSIMQYFDYMCSREYFKQRLTDLKGRQFKRNELVNALEEMNEQWHAPQATFRNIERLKDSNSVVVIGGQQAGMLTGPLYTIHKIISIIQFAKQKEAELNVPVIPLFWIAGEDHDFEEINHIFLPISELEGVSMKKVKLNQPVIERMPVSSIKVDEFKANKWLDDVFEHLQETAYTKEIYTRLKKCLDQSDTYVDFFAHVIFQLFQDEGLVLMDSGDRRIRAVEKEYFQAIIDHQPTISKGVYQTLHELKKQGYPISLDVEENSAHLFYHDHHERILLVRNEAGDWVGKNGEVKLTTAEIQHIATHSPERLSNNVVTRPLMQEMLFPTLAFIGGPGEISYWSVLKPAFHALRMKMPPVLPRLSITLVPRNVEKLLENYGIKETDAINGKLGILKEQWLASQDQPPVQEVAKQIKDRLNTIHKPLRQMAREFGSDLEALAQKNLDYLHRDIEFIEGRMMQAIEDKYRKELHEFAILQMVFNPSGGLQERKWNILPFINEFGSGWMKNLMNKSFSFANSHFVVYM